MKLWKHQEEAIAKFKGRNFFGLLFDCGTGKTLTALKIAEEKEKPLIIIAPNALCEQWVEEIKDKGEKEWETFLLTSQTKKKKNFEENFRAFLEK